MAPITRSGASSLAPEGLQPPLLGQKYREASWQFVGQPEARSDRALSEEPASSYDEDADMNHEEEEEDERQLLLEGPEDHEDILHPLREAANRVGREVEKFAEVLDGYNPQRVNTGDEKHDLVMELLDNYHNIAAGTVDRLRERHDAERRKKAGLKLRKKLRGFEFGQDELELYDEDQDSPLPAATTSVEDLERWEQEAQTWDLLHRLVKLRHPPPGESAQPKQVTKLHKYSSGREIWETFLETDTLALERKTVLDWLKGTAKDAGEDIDVLVEDLQHNADRGEIVANGWLYTNQAIKNQKRIHSWHDPLDPTSPEVRKSLLNKSNTAPLVTQLDPDAPTRQNRKLESQDQYFERAIWLGCYEMLRRGKTPAEIGEWCTDRSEVWRGVSMPALPDEIEQDTEITNPGSWALWRRMCFALARNGGGDDYERAVYGILSGDNISVEQVSRSWDDFVFAHYNALLRTQYDEFLKNATLLDPAVAVIDTFNAVQFHGEPRGAGRRLIENLRHDSRTTTEALEPMKMLQGVLIADNFKEFILQQGLALSKFANAEQPSFVIPVERAQPNNLYKYIREEDHDGLRVLTHVLLIFMHLGVDLGGIYTQTTIENVIVSYIGFLRFAGKEELIPLYCSQLTGTRKYTVLSRMLIDVTDSDQRLTQIRLMRELGLSVQDFVKKQARYVFSDYPDNEASYPASNFTLFEGARKADGTLEMRSDFVGEDTTRVSRTDILLIRSFEWYLLVDGLWSETFEVGTMLYKRFFKHMHLTSAKCLLLKMPSSMIALSKTHALIGDTVDFAGLAVESDDITEVLDGQADRQKALKKHLIEQAKSFCELEALIQALDLLETARSLQLILLEQRPKTGRWNPQARHSLAQDFEAGVNIMAPLLDNWLLTCPNPEWEEEFTQLREAYLPETILAYIHTLQFVGSVLTRTYLMECMDLATNIAEDNSDLMRLFEKTGKMPELVEGFAAASKTLLLISSEKKGGRSRGKKARIRGWEQDLWNVEP